MVDGHIKRRKRRVTNQLFDEADATAYGKLYKKLVGRL
jgi:hypothetical protein